MDYKQAISFDQLASISELGDPREVLAGAVGVSCQFR